MFIDLTSMIKTVNLMPMLNKLAAETITFVRFSWFIMKKLYRHAWIVWFSRLLKTCSATLIEFSFSRTVARFLMTAIIGIVDKTESHFEQSYANMTVLHQFSWLVLFRSYRNWFLDLLIMAELHVLVSKTLDVRPGSSMWAVNC